MDKELGRQESRRKALDIVQPDQEFCPFTRFKAQGDIFGTFLLPLNGYPDINVQTLLIGRLTPWGVQRSSIFDLSNPEKGYVVSDEDFSLEQRITKMRQPEWLEYVPEGLHLCFSLEVACAEAEIERIDALVRRVRIVIDSPAGVFESSDDGIGAQEGPKGLYAYMFSQFYPLDSGKLATTSTQEETKKLWEDNNFVANEGLNLKVPKNPRFLREIKARIIVLPEEKDNKDLPFDN